MFVFERAQAIFIKIPEKVSRVKDGEFFSYFYVFPRYAAHNFHNLFIPKFELQDAFMNEIGPSIIH